MLCLLNLNIPLYCIHQLSSELMGFFFYFRYKAAISIIASGLADPKPMITHQFNLEDTVAACDMVHRRVDGVVKIMISCSSKY